MQNMHHVYRPIFGMSIWKDDYLNHLWMWIWRGWQSPVGLYECSWHRGLSPMTRQVLAVTQGGLGVAASFAHCTCCTGGCWMLPVSQASTVQRLLAWPAGHQDWDKYACLSFLWDFCTFLTFIWSVLWIKKKITC